MFVSPWLVESRSYKMSNLEHHTSRITHHTSHITNWIWICQFYKILVITIVGSFNNSLQLIWKKLTKYQISKIIALPIQMHMSSPTNFNENILRWKENLSEQLGFPDKSRNSKTLVKNFKSDWTFLSNHNSENITVSVFFFNLLGVMFFLFFL